MKFNSEYVKEHLIFAKRKSKDRATITITNENYPCDLMECYSKLTEEQFKALAKIYHKNIDESLSSLIERPVVYILHGVSYFVEEANVIVIDFNGKQASEEIANEVFNQIYGELAD